MRFYRVDAPCGVIAVGNVMSWSGLGQGENGIIFDRDMSGEMHMRRRRDAKMRYSAAYPTYAER